MQKSQATTPSAYVDALDGWRLTLVRRLRRAARSEKRFEEVIKWGHLVYLLDGPVLLIRAEAQRVLFGFWHGQRLLDIEPRLEPGGKYEMATLDLREGDDIAAAKARELVHAAAELNVVHGDPRDAAPTPRARRGSRRR